MKYLSWSEEKITDFSQSHIDTMYEKGYVLTRINKGTMQQTRSLRIDLEKFTLSSENRRILRKIPDLSMKTSELPFAEYNFLIGKMAKDFYDTKFGEKIMSAQKIKEMLTDKEKSNFNFLLKFNIIDKDKTDKKTISPTGFCISYTSEKILHYSYPFYDLTNCPKDMGLAMMISAICYAKEKKMNYIYLGSLQRPTDTYKLQFSGLEWFDGQKWNTDLDEAKRAIKD